MCHKTVREVTLPQASPRKKRSDQRFIDGEVERGAYGWSHKFSIHTPQGGEWVKSCETAAVSVKAACCRGTGFVFFSHDNKTMTTPATGLQRPLCWAEASRPRLQFVQCGSIPHPGNDELGDPASLRKLVQLTHQWKRGILAVTQGVVWSMHPDTCINASGHQ